MPNITTIPCHEIYDTSPQYRCWNVEIRAALRSSSATNTIAPYRVTAYGVQQLCRKPPSDEVKRKQGRLPKARMLNIFRSQETTVAKKGYVSLAIESILIQQRWPPNLGNMHVTVCGEE